VKRFYITKLVQDERGRMVPHVRRKLSELYGQEPSDDRQFAVRTFMGQGLPFAVCFVDVVNQTEVAADADSLQFPDLTLDATLTNQERSRITTWLQGRGFNTSAITGQTTVAQTIELIAAQVGAEWNRNHYDINR